MAQLILDKFKTQVGQLALIPSGGGAFEITVGDDKIYSKLETGRFPSETAIVAEIGAKL